MSCYSLDNSSDSDCDDICATILRIMNAPESEIAFISVPYSPYFPHLFGYIEKAKTIPKSVLILSYEEMKENPVREVERIAQFLNLSLQPDELEEVAQLTSFQSMKANPATNYEHWDSLGLRDKKETVFMRKGNEGHSSQRHSKTATLQSELLFGVVFDHF